MLVGQCLKDMHACRTSRHFLISSGLSTPTKAGCVAKVRTPNQSHWKLALQLRRLPTRLTNRMKILRGQTVVEAKHVIVIMKDVSSNMKQELRKRHYKFTWNINTLKRGVIQRP